MSKLDALPVPPKEAARVMAVRLEAMDHVCEWVDRRDYTPAHGASVGQLAEAVFALIAKRDERIEALERRLAALEGDAK